MLDAVSADGVDTIARSSRVLSNRGLWSFFALSCIFVWARAAWEPAISATALSEAISLGRVPNLFSGQAINLNDASAQELAAIPGIGDATAAKIIDDRSLRGPFHSVDDLDRVKGVGPSAITRMRDYVRVKAESPLSPTLSAEPLHRRSVAPPIRKNQHRPARKISSSDMGGRPVNHVSRQLNPNTASVADWERLPGIGPVLAAAIVHDIAERGPLVSVDDLTRIKGIGGKKLEKLRPWLATVGENP